MQSLKRLIIFFVILISCSPLIVAQTNTVIITLENIDSLQAVGTLGTGNLHIAFSPNGEFVAVLRIIPATDNTMREDHIIVWQLSNLTQVSDFFIPELVIETFSFHTDNIHLMIGDISGNITVWDSVQEQVRTTWLAHQSRISVIELHPDNPTLLATASSRINGTSPVNNLILWDISDLENPSELAQYRSEFGSNITSGIFYDNSTFIVSIGLQLHIWDYMQIDTSQILTGHIGSIEDMVWLPNFDELITVGDARLIAWQTNPIVNQLPPRYRAVIGSPTFFDEPYAIYSVDVSADGEMLVTGDSAGELKVWDVDTLNLITSISVYDTPLEQVHFNQNNDTLITISRATDEVIVWRIAE